MQDVAKQSSFVRNALDIVNESIKAGECPDTPQLRKLCPTRSTMTTASIDSILKNYAAYISAFWKKSTTGTMSTQGEMVHGLKTSVEKFSTFFNSLSHFLFAASEQLSLSLQSKDISTQEAFKAASLTKSYTTIDKGMTKTLTSST